MPKITRKAKIVLENTNNEKETIIFTMTIEANHINNHLDQILQNMENMANIMNYKVKDDKKNDEDKVVPKKKKVKGFNDYGCSGSFV